MRLKKMNMAIKKRAKRMRAQLIDMKNRDDAMQAREEEVEDKLAKAAEKLATAREMARKGLDVEAETTRLMVCKSKMRELRAETRKANVDRKRDIMRQSLKDAHASNVKDRTLEEQKQKAIDMQETAEIDAIKKELREQQAELKSLVKIQKKFQALNKKKQKDLATQQKALKSEKRVTKFSRKRLMYELNKLSSAQLVKLSDVYKLLGHEAGDLIKEKQGVVSHQNWQLKASATLAVTACDREWCGHARAEFGVNDGKSWGRANAKVQKEWMEHQCHDSSVQDNTGCDTAQNKIDAHNGVPSDPMPPAVDPSATTPVPPAMADSSDPSASTPATPVAPSSAMPSATSAGVAATPAPIVDAGAAAVAAMKAVPVPGAALREALKNSGYNGFEKPASYEDNAGAMGGTGTELKTGAGRNFGRRRSLFSQMTSSDDDDE